MTVLVRSLLMSLPALAMTQGGRLECASLLAWGSTGGSRKQISALRGWRVFSRLAGTLVLSMCAGETAAPPAQWGWAL